MIRQEASGTQTAVVGTEHSLATVDLPGRFRLRVDLTNLASSEIVELRVKVKVLSTGAVRLEVLDTFTGGVVVAPSYESPEVWSPHSIEATLKQTSGTGRAFDWSVMMDEEMVRAAVVSDAGNTATTFKTDRTEAADDFWNGTFLQFITGSLAGQVRKVSDYVGATKFVVLSPSATATPAAGDKFILANR